MKTRVISWLAGTTLALAGCGGIDLPLPTQELTDIIQRLGVAESGETASIVPDLVRLNTILIETYKDQYQPIADEEMARYNPMAPQNYDVIDALRWGYGITAVSENPATIGAFVVRPVSVGFTNHIPLILSKNWAGIFPTGFRTHDRTFVSDSDVPFLAGTADSAEADNHVIYKALKGIVFEYDSHSLFRRIKDPALPGGEALIYWEKMAGEATRIEGGYNAYLTFLKSVHIFLPFTEKLSWRFAVSWSESGGSLFFFSGTGSSGDVGEGIRKDFIDLEAYLTTQGLSCGSNCL